MDSLERLLKKKLLRKKRFRFHQAPRWWIHWLLEWKLKRNVTKRRYVLKRSLRPNENKKRWHVKKLMKKGGGLQWKRKPNKKQRENVPQKRQRRKRPLNKRPVNVLLRRLGSNVSGRLKRGGWPRKRRLKNDLKLRRKKCRSSRRKWRRLLDLLSLALHFHCLDWVVVEPQNLTLQHPHNLLLQPLLVHQEVCRQFPNGL